MMLNCQLLALETSSITSALVLFLLLFWLLPIYIKFRRRVNIVNKIPGPPTVPLLGNVSGAKIPPTGRIHRMNGFARLYARDGIFRLWFGPRRSAVFLTNYKAVEPLVTSSHELHKGQTYDMLRPWLGDGLITVNHGKKWQTHRKLVTPAFHFKILEDFLTVMNEQAKVLVGRLRKRADAQSFDLYPYVSLCALDIISESAMGVSINAQRQEGSEYIQAVKGMTSGISKRQTKIWLRIKFIYRMSEQYHEDKQNLEVLKGFTQKVIQEKKKSLENPENQFVRQDSLPEGSRKKMAFLDLVLSANKQNGRVTLTDEEIQEQVDTFMFAGHDTTSTAISWFMFIMGSHPEIQEKVYDEQMEILGDTNREPDSNDLRKMKYLDRCTKEALRILPSVPFFGRQLLKDTMINGYLVPAGTSANVFVYALHRDPSVWKDPDIFNPDRFLNEEISKVNPYAYIPFSAGPRNCIGQKFAQMEEKVVVSHLIRNYKISTDMRFDSIMFQTQIILYPTHGVNIKLLPRS